MPTCRIESPVETDRRSPDRQFHRQEIHRNMYGCTLSEFLSHTGFGRGELWPKNRVDSVAKGAGVRARFAILIADSTKTFPVPGRPGSGDRCGEPRCNAALSEDRLLPSDAKPAHLMGGPMKTEVIIRFRSAGDAGSTVAPTRPPTDFPRFS